MASSRCRVSFSDSEGILHGVAVDAESLYEAVASFREDDGSASSPDPKLTLEKPASHNKPLGAAAGPRFGVSSALSSAVRAHSFAGLL
jgi:hypothetical protein